MAECIELMHLDNDFMTIAARPKRAGKVPGVKSFAARPHMLYMSS